MTTNNLLRNAIEYAIQDRLSWLEAVNNCKDDPEWAIAIKEVQDFIRELRKYRDKRWSKKK